MFIQYILIGIITFLAAIIPPVSPVGYSFAGILLLQKADPRILLIVSVAAATVANALIRIVQTHLIKKWAGYATLEHQNRFQRFINRINRYIRRQEKLTKFSSKRERYAETNTGKVATFLFAVFCHLPILPDIIGARILYKKIKMPYFILAVIIGKTISHGVFIFAGKTFFELLHLVK